MPAPGRRPCALCKDTREMIAIGSHFYPIQGQAEQRQVRSRASLLQLDRVVPVNLQFHDEDFRPGGFQTRLVLRQDSRTVTGAGGRRKPIVSEMFDALAEAARDAGCRYFAYINNDIEVTSVAVERILTGGRPAYAFSRVDLEPETRAELGVQLFGLDAFAIDVEWWARARRRFRPYIVGEPCWDNVYAALICAHGRGEVVYEQPGIFHEQHPQAWNDGPFAEHNGFLAALDAPDFSRWVKYVTQLEARISAGLPVDVGPLLEKLADARLSPGEQMVHAARKLRAHFRYARVRRTIAAATPRQSPGKSDPAAP